MESEHFDKVGHSISGNNRSSMFGVSCYKIGRKPFIMFYDKQIVCKLLDTHREEAMKLKGTTIFNPKNNAKPMANWIQIPYEHVEQWEYFATLAYKVVSKE